MSAYAPEGAFTASINWYRAGAGSVARSLAERPPAPADRITVPTTVLWPSHDPLFPPSWSDRIGEFFADARLIRLPGAGHFTPLERPGEFAAAITAGLLTPGRHQGGGQACRPGGAAAAPSPLAARTAPSGEPGWSPDSSCRPLRSRQGHDRGHGHEYRHGVEHTA